MSIVATFGSRAGFAALVRCIARLALVVPVMFIVPVTFIVPASLVVPVIMVALLAPAAPARAQDWGLSTLLAAIALNSSGSARFVERKFIAALDAPVDSSGELEFIKPARLEKRTLKPRPETMILDGDQLTIERSSNKRSMSLQQVPQAAALVESLRATLAGDRKTLDAIFKVALQGAAPAWTLSLQPLAVSAAQMVKEVRISGAQGDVQLIEIDQGNGDRSVMRVLR